MTENNDVIAALEDELRGKEFAVIPWTIKKYDLCEPSAVCESRTAFHKGVLLVVLIRANGTGMTFVGTQTKADEVRWDDITDGIAYVEEKFK